MFAFLLLAVTASAAILPDQVGEFKKQAPKTLAAPDQSLYDEYGFDSTEQADYVAGTRRFAATTWRFHDSTGAMAMFEARRPALATRSAVAKLAVQTSDGIIFAYGNYLFQLTGAVPPDVSVFYADLPKLEQSPLPALYGDLPPEDLIPNSERYVVGPVSLDRFFPGLAPSLAAFHLGAEAQIGHYSTPKGPLLLAIFNYPTPNMARERVAEFQKISGAMVKRAGPLVAMTLNPPDADAAEKILSRVKYETNITWNEKVPENEVRNTARLVLNIFVFSGILIALAATAGVLFGGYRFLFRKLHKGEDPEAMITLHLEGK
ncbi:MAG: hypothetical protein LAO79_16110 [Acidobacteriia bacterium]|nr:hypothetical protein [Terriglobia bacterium]